MKYIYTLFFVLIISACNGQDKNTDKQQVINANKRFELVSIPATITQPEKRAEYLTFHYWDNFHFNDTTYTHLPEVTEQALSDYLDLLRYVSHETAIHSIHLLMKQAEQNRIMFNYFSDMMEKYLYDSDSPLKDEKLYSEVLKYIINSSSLSKEEKIRPLYQLQLVLKNNEGDHAHDFSYTLNNGQQKTLYDTQAQLLLLFFYNPDCEHCQTTLQELKKSPIIKQFIAEKKLMILAIFPDGERTLWKKHIQNIPDNWINGYDESISIVNEEIYDLKSMPTLYLLDKEKTVLLKDCHLSDIEDFLQKD